MGITELLVEHITAFIDQTGYTGICILMVFESMIAPVPSEAVMPFAGFLIADGRFTFAGIVFWSTVGSIIGSLLSYVMGAYGGRPVVERFGKYLLLDRHHLDLTEKYFAQYGEITIFVCRFVPVIRHLISVPAGMGRMPLLKFCVYTIVGAGLWNAFLTWMGVKLQQNWSSIMHYTHAIDKVIVVALVVVMIWIVRMLWQQRQRNKK
jgi:membrane protein DedA with SNARE-associated domain